MILDETLCQLALTKASGANIHDVKCVIGCYRSGVHLVNNGKTEWTDYTNEWAKILREFSITGVLCKERPKCP
jgi:hypothetical protein